MGILASDQAICRWFSYSDFMPFLIATGQQETDYPMVKSTYREWTRLTRRPATDLFSRQTTFEGVLTMVYMCWSSQMTQLCGAYYMLKFRILCLHTACPDVLFARAAATIKASSAHHPHVHFLWSRAMALTAVASKQCGSEG